MATTPNSFGPERQLNASPHESSPTCPMAGVLEVLTRPWTLHILWSLTRRGPMRFGTLRRSVEGISARLLTVRLRTLEDKGLVQRTVLPGKVTEVIYSPTERLADMNELMQQLDRLHAKWQESAGLDGTEPLPVATEAESR